MIKDIHDRTGACARQISAAVGLGYRRLLRWKKRVGAGQPALTPPGPKKTGQLPLAELQAEIAALRHNRHRTHGTSELHARHQGAISRRDFGRLVAAERALPNRARRQVCKHVSWHLPNLAWAIDSAECGRDALGRALQIHPVRDLCTRYGFKPLPALNSSGPVVAAHLEELFARYGAPLFLKRDNGGPLNHHAVDAVLARFLVIPLNSPPRYPPYNGAIENGIRQVKAALGECLPIPTRGNPRAVAPYIFAVQHELNCRPRRSLHGHSASEAYHHLPHARFTKRDRRATFEWIHIHAIDRINQLEKIDRRSIGAAWRLAGETWLRCQGLITVSINHKVLPHLPRKYVQN